MNPSETTPALSRDKAFVARRRTALAALVGLAAVAGPARAQMGGPGGGGGGGGGGHGMRQEGGARPDKDGKDAHGPDASMPRDLVAAFAARLRGGLPELALAPGQGDAFRDFVAKLTEVGQHNERRLQRILFHSASSISAAAPLKSYLAAEVDEGEGRQEALAELKLAFDTLDGLVDARQRSVLSNLFVATRAEVQTPRER
ncbi:MAG: hypothetical protein ABJD97_16430 [Betaproteobacteria bacterium]